MSHELPELWLGPYSANRLLEESRRRRLASFEHQDWKRRRAAWEKGRATDAR